MVGDAPLTGLVEGATWSGVIECRTRTFTALWHGQALILEDQDLDDGRYTLYNFIFVGSRDGVPVLKAGSDSFCFAVKPRTTESYRTLVDLCSGLGGMSHGLTGLGGHTLLHVDRSQLAVDTVKDNGGAVLKGDVSEASVQLQIHQRISHSTCACTVSAGVPCQPYSRQGMQLGTADLRSLTLGHVLQLGWRLQAACIVIECVAEIAGHEDVQLLLREFADRAGLAFHCTELELGLIWVSRRRRWWACLVPKDAAPFHLLPYPGKTPLPVVADVLTEWPSWPASEEQDLAWTEAETRLMFDPRYGQDQRVLDCRSQVPTALHSWGSALRPCPCGCRTGGFSDLRLQSGGLRGIGAPSGLLGVLRFLHPCEAAFFNGLSPAFRFLRGARAGLCLVGNISAPIQANWLFTNLQSWSAAELQDEPKIDPVAALDAFLQRLLREKQDFWPVPSLQVPREVPITFAARMVLPASSQPWQVHQVIAAAREVVGPGFSIQVYAQDRLRLRSAKAPATIPGKACHLALLTASGTQVHHCQPGDTIAEVLHRLGLPIGFAQVLGTDAPDALHAPLCADAVVDLRPPVRSPLSPGAVSDVDVDRALQRLRDLLPAEAACLPTGLVSALAGLTLEDAKCFGSYTATLPAHCRLLLPLVADGHWACLCAQVQPNGLAILYLDGVSDRLLEPAKHLGGILAELLANVSISSRAFPGMHKVQTNPALLLRFVTCAPVLPDLGPM